MRFNATLMFDSDSMIPKTGQRSAPLPDERNVAVAAAMFTVNVQKRQNAEVIRQKEATPGR